MVFLGWLKQYVCVLLIQTDDATLVYYRRNEKEMKYLALESDIHENMRDYNITLDRYVSKREGKLMREG